MNISKKLLAASVAAIASGSALATPTLTIDWDSDNDTYDATSVVYDNGAGDTLGGVNDYILNAFVSGDLLVNVATGWTYGDPGAHLTVSASSAGHNVAGDLTVTYSDTDFTGGQLVEFLIDYVENASIAGLSETKLFVSEANCNFSDLGCVMTEVWNGAGNTLETTTFDLTGSAQYGLSLQTAFELDNPFNFSADFDVAVPEPGSIALLSLGLLGLGAARRKSK